MGGTTKLKYDKHGNLIEKALPNGAKTTFIRDARGLPIEIVDTAKQSSYFEYDLSGNLIAYINKSGQTRTYGYDREDRLIYTKDALNQKTEYLYTKENLTQVIYPDNSMVKLEYDKQNRVIAHTNRDGKVTKYHYNQQGKLSQKEDALNNTLNYNYDQAGRLEELINENQESYHFAYDPLDRLIKEQGLDGLSSEYNYDEINNLTKKIVTTIDNQTQETILSHNPIGEYSTKTVTLGDKTSQSAYKYDLLGNLIEAVNRTNRVLFEYNEMGQLNKEITELTENEEDIERVLEHEYDELGNRVKTILPDKREVEWVYNELGSVQEILIDKKTITTIQRDELNRELSRTQGVLESFKEYDSLGRLVNQSTYNQSDILEIDESSIDFAFDESLPLLKRSYSYNRAGELSEIHDRRHGKTTYQYDSIGRILETVSPLGTETFNFDPAHNLLDPDKPEQTKVKHNQIETYQDKRYKYDSFGNLTNKKISSHTNINLIYDAEHQLIESQVTKENITKVYNYDYDPFGRRTRKKDEEGTTHFIWDGNRLLTEQTDNKTSQTYIYEQNSFTPLALIDEQSNVNYYHVDQIGTPRELTNEDGEIIWEAQYRTWGNISKESYNEKESKLTQSFRFQGQYFDAETGLHYNRFRYYDPDIGRFISQDPIGLLGGNNLYQYAPNPAGWVDPFGLSGELGCFCDGEGGVAGVDLDGDGKLGKDEVVTLYHGTDAETAKKILENGQDASYSRNNLDFGKGIYTTQNKEQATIWAKSSGKRQGADGAVIEYQVPKDKLEALNTKEFSMNPNDYPNRVVTPGSELDSMYREHRTAYNTTNPNGTGKETTPREGYQMHEYDVVSGPMLSGTTRTAKNPKPLKVFQEDGQPLGDQTTFHTPKAVDLLNSSQTDVTTVKVEKKEK